MSIRINPSDRLEVLRPDIVIVHDKPQASDAPMLIERAGDDDTSAATGPRRLLSWVAVAAVVAIVAAAFAVGVVVGGDDAGTSATTNKPRSGSAPAAGELQVSVEAPARVVAGEPATFTVEYAGPPALFSGTVEDWGDGVGVASTSQGACAAAPKAQTPLSGRYTVSHTWAEPGTYPVVLGVNAFSCVGDQPRPTAASSTLTVTVVAP